MLWTKKKTEADGGVDGGVLKGRYRQGLERVVGEGGNTVCYQTKGNFLCKIRLSILGGRPGKQYATYIWFTFASQRISNHPFYECVGYMFYVSFFEEYGWETIRRYGSMCQTDSYLMFTQPLEA